VYRKGELSPSAVDRGWPHQVALPANACENGGYKIIHDFCKDLSRRASAAKNSIQCKEGRGAIGCGGGSEILSLQTPPK
jgi:hypothetical protein